MIEIRANPTKIEVIHNSIEYGILDSEYSMGKKYTIKITASEGVIDVYHNDLNNSKISVPCNSTGNYFKVGTYTQSNPSKGDDPDDYSEVWVYSLDVVHSA